MSQYIFVVMETAQQQGNYHHTGESKSGNALHVTGKPCDSIVCGRESEFHRGVLWPNTRADVKQDYRVSTTQSGNQLYPKRCFSGPVR